MFLRENGLARPLRCRERRAHPAPLWENTNVQRSVEVLVGRLITDEEFRSAFRRDPRGTLRAAAEWGLELTASELQALAAADHGMWDRFAEEIDGRLQKASLKPR